MTISKIIIDAGDRSQLVKKYDEVAIEYTGWILDPRQPDKKGIQFDTSIGRGDTITIVGAGRLLKGWDKGILGDFKSSNSVQKAEPMALNEKARFELPPEYGYGVNGFPGQVPGNATLIYWLTTDSEMELKRIGPQKAP